MQSYYFQTIAAAALLSTSILIARWVYLLSTYQSLPGPKPSSIFGYLADIHHADAFLWHTSMTTSYGHIVRLQGRLLGRDALYIADPTAINHVLVRRQDSFQESVEFSGLFGVVHHGDALASVQGREHRRQRRIINPAFTASNLSKLVPMFYKIAEELKDRLSSHNDPSTPRNLQEDFSRVTLEFIAQGGIGYSFDSLNDQSIEFLEFHNAITGILPLAGKLFLFLPFFETFRKMRPIWMRRWLYKLIEYIPWKASRHFKKAIDTTHQKYVSIFEDKKTNSFQSYTDSADMTSLFMKFNDQLEDKEKLSDELIIASMSGIVLGGQETTSGVLSRIVSLLAEYPTIQRDIRKEIVDMQKMFGHQLSYEKLNQLSLLDAFINETLRMYPPVPFVWRQTMSDTAIALAYPIASKSTKRMLSEITITQGTPVYVGIAAYNRSPQVWGEDADCFKPERWFTKTPNAMTFLAGNRTCPGMRFALLEIKLLLSILLPSFSFHPGESIKWRLGITVAPYLKDHENEGPKMPLKVVEITST